MLKAGLRNILYHPNLNFNTITDKVTNSKVDSNGRLSLKSTFDNSKLASTQGSNNYKPLKKQFISCNKNKSNVTFSEYYRKGNEAIKSKKVNNSSVEYNVIIPYPNDTIETKQILNIKTEKRVFADKELTNLKKNLCPLRENYINHTKKILDFKLSLSYKNENMRLNSLEIKRFNTTSNVKEVKEKKSNNINIIKNDTIESILKHNSKAKNMPLLSNSYKVNIFKRQQTGQMKKIIENSYLNDIKYHTEVYNPIRSKSVKLNNITKIIQKANNY